MRHFILAAEDRERILLEKVDKFRQQKLTALSDQMAGLRSALAGLAQTSEMLAKGLDPNGSHTSLETVQILTRGENQMEQFATMYKNLQPREEFIHLFHQILSYSKRFEFKVRLLWWVNAWAMEIQ